MENCGDELLMSDLFLWGFSKTGAGTGKEAKGLWHMNKCHSMTSSGIRCGLFLKTNKAGRFRKMESRGNLLGLFTFCNFHVRNKRRPVFQKPDSRCVF